MLVTIADAFRISFAAMTILLIAFSSGSCPAKSFMERVTVSTGCFSLNVMACKAVPFDVTLPDVDVADMDDNVDTAPVFMFIMFILTYPIKFVANPGHDFPGHSSDGVGHVWESTCITFGPFMTLSRAILEYWLSHGP